ncbi:tRNA uridine-5-carboxymethylaminomethyl(34) synthesis GTPase MnmE [Candidatus Phytoplasma phoenicium]|uniref:tRNA modification GTPase MnmE n=1 Tax=Candidatus Phytoplasma phoenicium TaxID=198422 RepID=A0A0L0MIN1_9MOLU|nr:tRNA uridine-5-carboxymethylaminomethyl(34) synthesis GTPase MnmE [Candidatus Phytoplasma phoenicium]KND62547.1 tRNA modification GTPase TrmE [Candidatus Phytoplasma phoenicium]
MFKEDTIAAIATPLGTGSISVIRISGNQAIENVSQIFLHKKPKTILAQVASHTVHHGFILDKNQEILDEVLITIFKNPNSFTGENVVEISCHGGILVTQLVLESILSTNTRLAQPGEFSKRAFLNGKIDLVQAEAIMDLIASKNKNAIKLAHHGLQKKHSQLITNLNNDILTLIGKIEVNIDYPEYEDIPTMNHKIIRPQVEILIHKIQNILRHSIKTRILKEGIKILIIGKPNVGKSSLLNTLAGTERAIVSDIAGTTRDFVDTNININGVNLNLIDTAGIRETNDSLEQIGVQKAKKLLYETDLVLLVLDQSNLLTSEDEKLLKLTQKHTRILIGSKADLNPIWKPFRFEEEIILISNNTKEGIQTLKKKILTTFQLDFVEKQDFNYFSNVRHIQQLNIALNALQHVIQEINEELPIDMHTIYLKEAFQALGEILGYNTEDQLIKELFSKFCLGK